MKRERKSGESVCQKRDGKLERERERALIEAVDQYAESLLHWHNFISHTMKI